MFEIGNILRDAREQRSIDLVDAEHHTKIRAKYLAALEHEEFDVLPGPVFVRGFLRTYSRFLGLEPQHFIDEYNARFGRFEDADENPVLGRRSTVGDQHVQRSRFMRYAIVASLIALAFVIWLGLTGNTDAPSDAADIAAGDVIDGSDVAANESASDTSATADESQQASDSTADVDSAADAAAPSATPNKPAAPQRASLQIVLDGGASWIEVRRQSAQGAVLFSGELEGGTKRGFAAPKLFVTVGRPDLVQLISRGTTISPTSQATSSWIVTAQGIREA